MNFWPELLLKQSLKLRLKTYYFCSVRRLIRQFEVKARAHTDHHVLLLFDNDFTGKP
jgi:hypothetical protein